jgi:hypothetical protein
MKSVVQRAILLGLFLLSVLRASTADRSLGLAEALLKEDAAAIRAAVEQREKQLGELAGVPQAPEKYLPLPKTGNLPSASEIQRGFTPFAAELNAPHAWRVGMDPTKMSHPLRNLASLLFGHTAICRAQLDGADQSLVAARELVEFLIWAQQQAGNGVYPFPAARGTSKESAMVVAEDFLVRAERAGKLAEVTRNNWIIDDLQTGALQFDNAECGVAMFEYYELTQNTNALASAVRAADWAKTRPLVPDWHYNSFSVYLLAKAYEVTGNQEYLNIARKKALLGMIPGQLLVGPRSGRWVDRQNARPGNHYTMMRSLAELLHAMPDKDPSRSTVRRALILGLRTRNSEIIHKGAIAKEKSFETLVLVNTLFADDPSMLRDSMSQEAFNRMAYAVTSEAGNGTMPVAPHAWGTFLELLKHQTPHNETVLHGAR